MTMISSAPVSPVSGKRLEFATTVQALGMLPVLILIAILFQLLSGYSESGSVVDAWSTGRFMSWQNLAIVMQQASINTVLAAGMTFVILTGGIDLSVGSVLAASAMAAIYASLIPGWGLLGVPAALLIGGALGLINGVLIAFLRLPPFIVTLGALTAVRGLARLMGNDTTVFNPNLSFAFIGNGTLLGIPWLVIIAALVVVASWVILRRTVLGVYIYAVGGNPDAARLSGIKVWIVLLFVYGLSGLLAGLMIFTVVR